MLLYRLGKTKYARSLNGAGAREYPGRWNSSGQAMVYTSETSSTCVLEVRVHVGKVPRNSSLSVIEVPDGLSILTVSASKLPHGWNWMRYLNRVRAVGNDFLDARKYLMLRVPSAANPTAWNCLLNPAHPEMAKVKVIRVEPYVMDPRLFRTH